MIHTILILGHAFAGVVALVFGCVVMRPPSRRSVAFDIYYVALLTTFVLVLAVVVYDWAVLTVGNRATFSLLAVLGAYTAIRGIHARRALHVRPMGWRRSYVDHVGFTVISLFAGFAIVSAVDVGAPLPVILVVGVLGVVAGVTAIHRVKARLHSVPASAAQPGQSTDTAITNPAG